MSLRFAVLFLAALCVQSHCATRSDAFQSAIPNYKKTTNRNFELQVHRLGDQRNNEIVYLDDQVEGRRVDLKLRVINHTDLPISDISTNTSCACLVTKITGENKVPPGETLELDVKITPGRAEVRARVDIYTTDKLKSEEKGSPYYIFLGSFSVQARSLPPLRFDSATVEFSQANPTCTVKVLRALPSIKVSDTSKFNLNSTRVEIKQLRETDDYYELTIGLRDGESVPDRDFSATLFAPFTSGNGPEMMMNEVLTFIPNPRFEVAPRQIRMIQLKKDSDLLRGYTIYSEDGPIIVKNFTAQLDFEGMLVCERDGRPLLLDPDIVDQTKTLRMGESNAFRVTLAAKINYQLNADCKIFALFSRPGMTPDFDQPWDEFAQSNDLFPVSVNQVGKLLEEFEP